MCAKVAQNYKTKEELAKNPPKVCNLIILCTFVPDNEPLIKAGGSALSGPFLFLKRLFLFLKRPFLFIETIGV